MRTACLVAWSSTLTCAPAVARGAQQVGGDGVALRIDDRELGRRARGARRRRRRGRAARASARALSSASDLELVERERAARAGPAPGSDSDHDEEQRRSASSDAASASTVRLRAQSGPAVPERGEALRRTAVAGVGAVDAIPAMQTQRGRGAVSCEAPVSGNRCVGAACVRPSCAPCSAPPPILCVAVPPADRAPQRRPRLRLLRQHRARPADQDRRRRRRRAHRRQLPLRHEHEEPLDLRHQDEPGEPARWSARCSSTSSGRTRRCRRTARSSACPAEIGCKDPLGVLEGSPAAARRPARAHCINLYDVSDPAERQVHQERRRRRQPHVGVRPGLPRTCGATTARSPTCATRRTRRSSATGTHRLADVEGQLPRRARGRRRDHLRLLPADRPAVGPPRARRLAAQAGRHRRRPRTTPTTSSTPTAGRARRRTASR